MQHWTNYWKNTNALNSFAEGRQGEGYQEDIADFWNTQFELIKNHATVVDLGTGNGAVAVLADQFSKQNQLDWNVIGIDAAEINPQTIHSADRSITKSLANIDFIAKTPIEEIPFQPASIDGFVSQFAFEYSDIARSLHKCNLCLKSGGVIAMLSHHPESHITKDSKDGEEVISYILEQSPAFMQTDLLLDVAIQQGQSGQMHNWPNNPHRQIITSTLHWIFSQLINNYSSNPNQEYWCRTTIGQITKILQHIGKVEAKELKQHLEELYHNLSSHRLRLKDQIKASLCKEKLEIIRNFCSNNSLQLRIEELEVEGKLFAYQVIMKK